MSRQPLETTRLTLATMRVLAEILAAGRDVYGREIVNATGLKEDSVYPVLWRLEKHGWLTSAPEDAGVRNPGRPARRYYRFTPAHEPRAREILKQIADIADRFREALDKAGS